MRTYRSLIFGLLLAATWSVIVAGWQIVRGGREREAAPPSQPSAPTDATQEQDQGVTNSGNALSEDPQTAAAREQMVRQQLAARDVHDRRVLDAMRRVPRHRFVPDNLQGQAYDDCPLPIGHQQTISQPYIVALMTQLARPTSSSIALDVGTGSGYQAAVLSELCQEVYSIEIVEPLAELAKQRLENLRYRNVTVRCGDGYRGWPDKAPFDLIIVAAAPEQIPSPLIDQLKTGGRLVIPVGRYFQNLLLVEKQADGSVTREQVAPVAFVPMTGEAQRR